MRSVLTRLAMCIMAMTCALTTFSAHGTEIVLPRPIPGTSFEQHVINDDTGREVTYYMSRPKGATAPLLLMIQGSGCTPAFVSQQGVPISTVSDAAPFGT